ncbi:sulfurtransferase-like selenium metabolism protein YedF [Megalodesulfovibrio paquesii]
MTQSDHLMPVDLDCRGLACPQPVLQSKRLVEAHAPARLDVLVDNDAARENVTRFLQSRGYSVQPVALGADWKLEASLNAPPKDATAPSPEAASCEPCAIMTEAEIASLASLARPQILVFIPAATMGQGDDALGAKLMVNFIKTLPELGKDLWRIVLVNGGVHLAAPETPQDSQVLEVLQALERDGVSILVCGTCLEFFGIMDKKAVGQTTNMLDVVTSMQLATRIIRP